MSGNAGEGSLQFITHHASFITHSSRDSYAAADHPHTTPTSAALFTTSNRIPSFFSNPHRPRTPCLRNTRFDSPTAVEKHTSSSRIISCVVPPARMIASVLREPSTAHAPADSAAAAPSIPASAPAPADRRRLPACKSPSSAPAQPPGQSSSPPRLPPPSILPSVDQKYAPAWALQSRCATNGRCRTGTNQSGLSTSLPYSSPPLK